MSILTWDLYEITTDATPITGVMLRGRVRKFCLENAVNVLVENAQDSENVVRFALLAGHDPQAISEYLNSILPDVRVKKVLEGVPNPVLSKLKVNATERYTL